MSPLFSPSLFIDRIDVSENSLIARFPEVLSLLLQDHTTGGNIIWATDNYQSRGDGYRFHDPILPELITGTNGTVIMPRIKRDRMIQSSRIRDMAEVFTPAWICNAQNNLVDQAWFGYADVFNHEINSGTEHTWEPSQLPVIFPQGKTWQDYIRNTCLEITCGEAPYLTSRYDVTTGQLIPLDRRIGLLDRKFMILNKNTPDIEIGMPSRPKKQIHKYWRRYAYRALQSTYGYEWTGDNLLLAREAIFMTFIDYYQQKWDTHKLPEPNCLNKAAEIISWNIWQMDGIKYGIPGQIPEEHLDDKISYEVLPEKKLCRIKEWTSIEPLKGNDVIFQSLINHEEKS